MNTPGPWKVIPSPHGDKYRCVQIGADEMYTTLEMLPADADLIAAAPDLLEACQLAYNAYGCGSAKKQAALTACKKALQKARGVVR